MRQEHLAGSQPVALFQTPPHLPHQAFKKRQPFCGRRLGWKKLKVWKHAANEICECLKLDQWLRSLLSRGEGRTSPDGEAGAVVAGVSGGWGEWAGRP